MNAKAATALGCLLVLFAQTVLGQESGVASGAEDPSNSDDLSTITVVGTRTERTIKEVAATVTVITTEELESQITRDIADLVRYEPGVTVSGTGSRFGLSGFSIRGIGGNRVLTMVDGVRIPDEFSFGPFLSARRDFVDVDSLERAEIARGPISSLYGSDAIGGVVALTTRSPKSYLVEGDTFHGEFKGGYSSADESTVGTLTLVAGSDRISGLLTYTNRSASETENQGAIGGTGPTRELPDPLDLSSDNIVGKLRFDLSDRHALTLGFDYFNGETDAQLLSDYGLVVSGTTVDARDAMDTRERERFSLKYDYVGGSIFADRAFVTIYDQTSESAQLTRESRTTPAFESQTRERDSFFTQEIQGVYVQLSKMFESGNTSHLVTYGLDYYVTDSQGLRDGGTFDSTGVPIPEFSPLPTRDFPLTETDQLAFFIQDEISLLNDRLLVTPGLRFDSFDASATADAIYINGNPGSPLPEDYDDSEVTGRIGAVYALTDAVSVYGQFSQGFRAPPYDDVNVGFTNFIGGYKTISNPDLKSERSEGIELGLRFDGELGGASLGLFHTDYEDFIESFAVAPEFLPSGIDPADNLLTFQSINRNDVEIKGAEFSGYMNLGGLTNTLDGFSLKAAIAYAEGEDKETGEALNSIEPLSGVLGLAYTSSSDRWGGELVLTLIDGKDEGDIDSTNPRAPTSGYGLLDLLAYVQLGERVTINAGLFNLTDKTYIRWSDTGGIGADAPLRFTQPGLNAGATLRVAF